MNFFYKLCALALVAAVAIPAISVSGKPIISNISNYACTPGYKCQSFLLYINEIYIIIDLIDIYYN